MAVTDRCVALAGSGRFSLLHLQPNHQCMYMAIYLERRTGATKLDPFQLVPVEPPMLEPRKEAHVRSVEFINEGKNLLVGCLDSQEL